ncbi:hypothetical protein TBLA_0A04970 [Henningerozyma blattae CBS 6284]|uniref:Uncharacterized protein n=1 Tax=Henningerozyma blattae (strain ATCC 34711 / CBS 6284 / DSM 70876 / NBRC 10599 / NRRL Y-10934 / UCD 77-7) TaxID=1071380 RepID=I2GVY8_HENB6|nr:hypothetical protein TBLA_0A04970 [Tetrapisispora blattae CBS 6284]CCH58290.1 hypothetical protein TBLA_0A04970 [Tetrapisispora blattae CBS 6284]
MDIVNNSIWKFDILYGLESICSVFDNIYFLRSIGLISDTNLFYRLLNRSELGSKIWLITLVLNIRKDTLELLKLLKLKTKISDELEFQLTKLKMEKIGNYSKDVTLIIKDKLQNSLKIINNSIKDRIFDLIQNLIYLLILLINIGGHYYKSLQRFKHILEIISNMLIVSRVFSTNFNLANF